MKTLINTQTNEIATYSDKWAELALNSGNFIEKTNGSSKR